MQRRSKQKIAPYTDDAVAKRKRLTAGSNIVAVHRNVQLNKNERKQARVGWINHLRKRFSTAVVL